MPLLPTTLLLHEGAGVGPHHDWLVADPARPGDAGALLWAVRVGPHWDDWPAWGLVRMTALAPHRRRYLSWEGGLSGGRGRVRRVGRGTAEVLLWTPRRAELVLHTGHATLRVALRREGGAWLAWSTACALEVKER